MGFNWNAIGSIGQWVGAVATFSATYIALRTAKDAKASYMLDQRPYLAFDNLEVTLYKVETKVVLQDTKAFRDSLQIGAVFRNVGKTIAKYEVDSFAVEIANVKASGSKKNSGGIVYPGLISIYRHAPIQIDNNNKHFSGFLEYKVKFGRSPNSDTYVSTKKIGFDIFLTEENIQWKYIVLDEDEKENEQTLTYRDKLRNILGL
jgi:hypothetical protein